MSQKSKKCPVCSTRLHNRWMSITNGFFECGCGYAVSISFQPKSGKDV